MLPLLPSTLCRAFVPRGFAVLSERKQTRLERLFLSVLRNIPALPSTMAPNLATKPDREQARLRGAGERNLADFAALWHLSAMIHHG